jgi:trans-L-3-hydroxyproline dehydratase
MRLRYNGVAAMNITQKYQTLDYHTAGEPLRILRSGLPGIPGATMLAKRRYMQANHDDVRRLLMLEPRGHADMYGAVVTGPVAAGSDCGVLFLHNEGYSTMCGHGIIALATAAIDHRLFAIQDTARIRIDTPAGPVEASANMNDGAVESIAFLNVPSFVQEQLTVQFNGRALQATIAFGGAYYAYVNATDTGIPIEPGNAVELVAAGRAIKQAVSAEASISHPLGDDDLNFLYGVIFVQPGNRAGLSRNACVFADGELDRSPTGTGVSGRAAIHFRNGDISTGDALTVESIIGTSFRVECVGETRVGALPAVLTRVTGSAHMTGEHTFVLDERDTMPQGFLIR